MFIRRITMKLRLSLLVACAALAASSSVFGQAAPSTATPATGASTTPTGKSSAKATPLGGGEKKFVKDASEGIYLVLDLVGKAKDSANADTTKKLAEKLKADLDKVWADVGGFGTANGETLPSELKGADKSAAERLKKVDKDKWDKQFLNTIGKEMKKVTRTFESGKSLQNAELKTIAEKWRPTLVGYDAEITKAEKDIAKTK